jgi:bifunctional non-homologous end joining protein LigD
MPELNTYLSRRDAARTPEPVPAPGSEPAVPLSQQPGASPSFVVQEHHATALHWDFRLERDGVLVSWALPKGLPTDPEHNHLAIHTEDHPLEYATFAGDIPSGEYGGGNVTVWDHGSYECAAWTDRKVEVVLHGERVSGRYVLFPTGRRDRDWMIHRKDPAPPGVVPMPDLIRPMLATATTELPRDDDRYGFEFKWDGVRAVVYVDGGRPRALSRNDRDVTSSYPELRAMAEALGSTRVVLDGEIVAMDAGGRPSFSALQSRMHVTGPAQVKRAAQLTPVTFLAFDLLYLDGRSLLDLPYESRREALDGLGLAGPSWQTPPWFIGGGAAVLDASRQQGLEGIVAKRLDSRYVPGRRADTWRKLKNLRTQEVVVAGWKPGTGRRSGTFGSLLLGVYDGTGLTYVGHVGTGFDEDALVALTADLAERTSDTMPFATAPPRADIRDAHWVEPSLVGEVAFSEWTPDGRLRHPAWRGLRPDKDPAEVVRES